MRAEKLRDLDEAKQAKLRVDPNWVAQLKLNGCRLLFHIAAKGNRFTSRGKSVDDFLFGEKTDNLPALRDLSLTGLDGTVLDGEIVSPYAVADTGKIVTRKALAVATAVINSDPSVAQKIQQKYGSMEYHVFDIVKFKGMDVRLYPYSRRLEFLKEVEEEYRQVVVVN